MQSPLPFAVENGQQPPRQLLLEPWQQQQQEGVAPKPAASIARALLATIVCILAAYGALMLLTNHVGSPATVLWQRAPVFAHAPSPASHDGPAALAGGGDAAYRAAAAANITPSHEGPAAPAGGSDAANRAAAAANITPSHEGPAALAGGSDAAYRAAAAANITAFRQQLLRQAWRSPVPAERELFNRTHWARFQPSLTCPSDRPLRKYGGTGDGSKLLCDLGARQLQRGCVIYSLGSQGNFQFEESMVNETDCEVHTFDCTYDGSSIQPGRHFYHKLCIGSRPGNPDFKPYSQIVRDLGHVNVDLLKMDIEGWEYAVFTEFQADDPLPIEISTELHILPHQPNELGPSDTTSLSLLFLNLASLGYGAYSMEVNPLAPDCCCEFSFMRFWPLP